MKSYHVAWLEAHPERSEEWLRARLCDGFHVHHVDGDHSNDEPCNLILVDGVDHLRLHGMVLSAGIDQWRRKPRGRKPKVSEIGHKAYAHRMRGLEWRLVAEMVWGAGASPRQAMIVAKRYAVATTSKWPI